MPGTKEIRVKIRSVQNTRKITKAMEMVAASKMRRAQERKDLFEDGIVAKLIDRGKVKINQDAIKRLLDSYRS